MVGSPSILLQSHLYLLSMYNEFFNVSSFCVQGSVFRGWEKGGKKPLNAEPLTFEPALFAQELRHHPGRGGGILTPQVRADLVRPLLACWRAADNHFVSVSDSLCF